MSGGRESVVSLHENGNSWLATRRIYHIQQFLRTEGQAVTRGHIVVPCLTSITFFLYFGGEKVEKTPSAQF